MSETTGTLDVNALASATVVSDSGDKIGKVAEVYFGDDSQRPEWVTVKTGLFGSSESFVPLQAARLQGDELRVPYSKDKVKDAPRTDDDGKISAQEEDRLYDYYGLGGGTSGTTTGTTTGTTGTTTGTTSGRSTSDRDRNGDGVFDDVEGRAVGRDTSGPTTDDAMTRSEEHLEVGTQVRESGRARLRKRVVTERETARVGTSHEEVHLEREPITDANAAAAHDGPAISEEEHEVVLHEEVPVVSKTATPVERVRLDTETVRGEQTVSDDVRKEQIDVDTDGDTRGTGRTR